MLSGFLVVASQVVTLFLLMGVGFALAKLGRLHTDGVAQMSYLALYIVTPCVIVAAFETENTPGLAGKLLQFGVVYALSTLVNLLVAGRCFRSEPSPRGNPLRFSMVYGNNGFMGLPLVGAILGPEALIFGVVSLVVFNFSMWTHGVKTIGGKVSLGQVLLNPATVGCAVGLTFFLTGWRPPAMVDHAIGFLADLNTPLAMLVIGAQMAGANLKLCFTSLRLYRAAAFRLVISPLIPLVLLAPLELDPLLYCVCCIMAAVPVAGATGMLAQRYGQDTAVAAQMVTLSTLLCVLTLPLVAVAAQIIAGLPIG